MTVISESDPLSLIIRFPVATAGISFTRTLMGELGLATGVVGVGADGGVGPDGPVEGVGADGGVGPLRGRVLGASAPFCRFFALGRCGWLFGSSECHRTFLRLTCVNTSKSSVGNLISLFDGSSWNISSSEEGKCISQRRHV